MHVAPIDYAILAVYFIVVLGIGFYLKSRMRKSISLFVIGKLFNALLGWNMQVSFAVSALVVLGYVVLGGLTSAIYNEVLQFGLIVVGFAPLTYLGLRDVGGWSGMAAKLPPTFTHVWTNLARPDANPLGVESRGTHGRPCWRSSCWR
jgi:SSS family solute:Na+ symporter